MTPEVQASRKISSGGQENGSAAGLRTSINSLLNGRGILGPSVAHGPEGQDIEAMWGWPGGRSGVRLGTANEDQPGRKGCQCMSCKAFSTKSQPTDRSTSFLKLHNGTCVHVRARRSPTTRHAARGGYSARTLSAIGQPRARFLRRAGTSHPAPRRVRCKRPNCKGLRRVQGRTETVAVVPQERAAVVAVRRSAAVRNIVPAAAAKNTVPPAGWPSWIGLRAR